MVRNIKNNPPIPITFKWNQSIVGIHRRSFPNHHRLRLHQATPPPQEGGPPQHLKLFFCE